MRIVPPTALRISGEHYAERELDMTYALQLWREYYVQGHLRPLLEGDLVLEYPRVVKLAVYLRIPEIECRMYFFDGELP